LKAISDEANTVPTVERWYFQTMPLQIGTSEVKGQRHFNIPLVQTAARSSSHRDPKPHEPLTVSALQNKFLKRLQKTLLAMRNYSTQKRKMTLLIRLEKAHA